LSHFLVFFFQAEDGIRDDLVTGVQTCALPISVSAADTGSVHGSGSPGTIITAAGNGTIGSGGDAGAATSAELNMPSKVALDAAEIGRASCRERGWRWVGGVWGEGEGKGVKKIE